MHVETTAPPQPVSPSANATPVTRHGVDLEWNPDIHPSLDDYVTEDDTPVDNFLAERQQPLLVGPLYLSPAWAGEGRSFLAVSNVGLFYLHGTPAVVPDMMLILDVRVEGSLLEKARRSYFTWIYGKVPDAIVEIVSGLEGGEDTEKLDLYARIGVRYYVIFDPGNFLKGGVLRAFVLQSANYQPISPDWLSGINLGLRLRESVHESITAEWLRWCDREGNVLPTGEELAERKRQELEAERAHTEAERQRAGQEHQRAEQERQRAERLAAQLRALGIDPAT